MAIVTPITKMLPVANLAAPFFFELSVDLLLSAVAVPVALDESPLAPELPSLSELPLLPELSLPTPAAVMVYTVPSPPLVYENTFPLAGAVTEPGLLLKVAVPVLRGSSGL